MQRSQKMGQGDMDLGIMERRHVKPRWINDPVRMHGGSRCESGQGWVRSPPPPPQTEIRRRAERANKNGLAT